MIVSNATYSSLKSQAGTRNRAYLGEFSGMDQPDWLLFIELNANEIPAKTRLELEE